MQRTEPDKPTSKGQHESISSDGVNPASFKIILCDHLGLKLRVEIDFAQRGNRDITEPCSSDFSSVESITYASVRPYFDLPNLFTIGVKLA